jgi:hypothetical protein
VPQENLQQNHYNERSQEVRDRNVSTEVRSWGQMQMKRKSSSIQKYKDRESSTESEFFEESPRKEIKQKDRFEPKRSQ